jgi:hypothetical protein
MGKNENFKTAIKTIQCMCYDVLTNGITKETFIYNLKNFIIYLEQEKE